jgi:hypothetical protein
MKYCEHCGTKVVGEPKFCENCGHSLRGADAPPEEVAVSTIPLTPVASSTEPAVPDKPATTAPKRGHKALVASVVAFVLLGAAAGGWVLVSRRAPEVEAPTPTSSAPSPAPAPSASSAEVAKQVAVPDVLAAINGHEFTDYSEEELRGFVDEYLAACNLKGDLRLQSIEQEDSQEPAAGTMVPEGTTVVVNFGIGG